jgi:hypothetical protein
VNLPPSIKGGREVNLATDTDSATYGCSLG